LGARFEKNYGNPKLAKPVSTGKAGNASADYDDLFGIAHVVSFSKRF
jgi:hypothetical protein